MLMSAIIIKSQANNRVRLKSDYFRKASNIALIENEFNLKLYDFRENLSAKSIVFKFNEEHITLAEIIYRLNALFGCQRNIELSPSACGSLDDCKSCVVKKQDPTTWRRKLIEFGLLSAFSVYLFVAENFLGIALASTPLSLVALVSTVAALPLLKSAWSDIQNNRFTLETFMSGTLILSIFFGEATAAFEIIYILRGGLLLEEYIATKSKNEIRQLIELDMKKVFLLVEDIELEVDLEDVKKGDIIVSRVGDKIPVDGIIVQGSGEIDEALINGRSERALKVVGDEVFAGTLCESGRIHIEVQATGGKTYIARVMADVESSLALKSPSEVEADRLASKLLKLGSFMTLGTLIVTGSVVNAFSVMIVMSCPCSTVLAASTAISAGIANAAKLGILVKGGEALEKVSQAEVFCFDKTGTLTTGKPLVADILTSNNINSKGLIQYAATAEYRNSHPIALAIIEHAKGLGVDINQEGTSEVIPGFGVKTNVGNELILVGNKRFFKDHAINIDEFSLRTEEFLEDGKTVVFVAIEGELLGLIALEHEVRAGTEKMIADLRSKGVKHIALITGDEEKVANSFALKLGFDTVFANQSPHDKATAIENLKKKYHNVVMVGDGVNDTLAMSKADVSISFAAGGSEAAIEVSDIAITHSHPEDVVNLYDISKKSLMVVNQNYWIGTSTNIVGAMFGAVGLLSPAAAGAIHIGHTTAIMSNSSRLAL
jgi:cation-transporting P-type ATPase C